VSAVAHIDEYKRGTFYSDEFRGEMSWNGYENNVLLRNLGPGDDGVPRFADVAQALGADSLDDARGIALLDYDNDGDLDIAVNHNPGDNGRDISGVQAKLLRNDVGQRHNWLVVTLEGATVNRDAVGATVRIETGEVRQLRLVSAGNAYASQQTRRLYFGLGEAARIDALTVRWPGGQVETHRDLEANRRYHLVEGRPLETRPLPQPTQGVETAP